MLKPRVAADYRALLWAGVLFPSVAFGAISWPALAPLLFPLSLYSAYAAGVLAHNHNHRRTFEGTVANELYGAWLSAFYGVPIVAWNPTHNQNHHRYRDGAGDIAATTRRLPLERDTLGRALTYAFAAGAWQLPAIARYLRERPRARRRAAGQIAAMLLLHGSAMQVSQLLHPGWRGWLAYGCALALPALLAPPLLQLTNYFQHLGCDPESPHDHSRNFVSRSFNWFVFENGYHTVHHEQPGQHWSLYPELHALRAARIAPHLNQRNPFSFLWQRYVAASVPSALPVPARPPVRRASQRAS